MRCITLPSLLTAMCLALPAQAEQRLAYSTASPAWLQAVGKLEVPGSRVENGYRRHKREDCSGTLVASAPDSRRADIVVTAWHCLEYYQDLSRPILFTLLPNSHQPITLEARRLDTGGDMHADWAVLQLARPVDATTVRGLTIDPAQADATRAVVMAGYSGDEGLGQDGQVMTYHVDCRITAQQPGASTSNCQAYKGASGGAVIQLDDQGQARLTGVISRGDSAGVSIFVPVEGFRSPLNLALR